MAILEFLEKKKNDEKNLQFDPVEHWLSLFILFFFHNNSIIQTSNDNNN